MKEWINAHRQALLLVLKKLRSAPLANLMMAGVIGVTLSLPAGLYLLVDNLKAAAGNISTEPQLTLFLALGSSDESFQALDKKLRESSDVRDFHFVSRDTAWRELQEKDGLGGATTGLEKNPLPDAFIVHPKNAEPSAVEALQQQLAQWPDVEHVQLDAAWVKRLYALLRLGNHAALILSGLLGFALFAIIGNTIRLQMLTQREEIAVSKLIGATDRFIRRPFLYAGVLHGLAGGIMAWLILYATTYIFNASVQELAQQYASDFHLAPLDLPSSLILAGCAASVGWIGAYLAVNRHLSSSEQN